MKKIVFICLAAALSSPAFSQTAEPATTKSAEKELSFKSIHGHEVLPQAGEWALGVSATGFLSYLGNIANGNTANLAPAFGPANGASAFAIGQLGGMAVMGKYMKTSSFAYRARFQVNAGSVDYRNTVLKSTPTPDPLNPSYTDDKMSYTSSTVLLGLGIEKRRGTGRVQGFYGAEALLGFAGGQKKYTYGNAFDINYNSPMSTTDFSTSSSAYSSSRVLENNTGTMFLFGVRGFAGVEYFIAPKLSLGGEMGYTLGYSSNGKGSVVTETWNAPVNQKATVTTDNYGASGLRSWGIGLDNVNAGINMHFYF